MESQDKRKHPSGQLFIVATPIGNLGDITYRAVEILRQVTVIAAEDTRVSSRLLSHYGIDTPMMPCHEHNEEAISAKIIRRLQEGADVALISDAGTPLINDPGFRLVRAVRAAGCEVVPVPGASSPIAALCASGLPTDAFTYLGFPPRSGKERRLLLQQIDTTPHTLVLLESPRRLLKTLEDLAGVAAQREICVARELTKLHETFVCGSLDAVRSHFESTPPRGEIVLMIGPRVRGEVSDDDILARLRQGEGGELPPSARARHIAGLLGVSKSRVYALMLSEQGE